MGGGVRWEQRPRGDPGREAKERRPHLSRGRDLFVTIEVFSPVLFGVAVERLKCRWCGCILSFIYIETRMAPVSLDGTGWRGSGEGHARRDIPLPCRRQVSPSSSPFPWEPVRNSLPASLLWAPGLVLASGATVTPAAGLSQGWAGPGHPGSHVLSRSLPGTEPQAFSLVLRGHVCLWLSDKLLHQRGRSLAPPCL